MSSTINSPELPTTRPITAVSLAEDLVALGISAGNELLVHCSFSALGNVYGGPQALIQALQNVLTATGTLVMPTHSTQLSDPANWSRPPAPEAWWPIIRRELPAYDPAKTTTRDMGVVAETFRRYPDVQRSEHPHGSFAAWGRYATQVTRGHKLEGIFGETSPLARLYDLDAKVLLIGVGHGNNTSLHLAEYRSDFPNKPYHREGAPMLVEGEQQWVEFEELQINSDDFVALGEAFAQQPGAQRQGKLGEANALVFWQPSAVDFATAWFNNNRR